MGRGPDRIAPPPVVHYCGHTIAPLGVAGRFPADAEDRVAALVAAAVAGVGVAFGSLACGADILFAEALLERGAELHVHLPCDVDDFVTASVATGGDGWRERFDRGLARATSVEVTTPGGLDGDDERFAYCSRIAMGHALIRAEQLAAEAMQLAVWDGEAPTDRAGTSVDVAVWEATGHPTRVIPVEGSDPAERPPAAPPACRLARASLVARLPAAGVATAALAAVLERFDGSVREGHRSADGVSLVFDDVVPAAAFALELRAALDGADPVDLAPRVALHAGPLLELAASLGSVPDGEIYATDPFTALLALVPATGIATRLVGRVPSAGGSTTVPVYRVGSA